MMTMFIVIHARSNSPSKGHRSCPEEYRELRRRSYDESSSDSDDDWREDACERAKDIAARQHDPIKSRMLLRAYCAYYDEAAALERENNDDLCEEKKRALKKRKRQASKKKRDDDSSDDSDDDDDDDDDDDSDEEKRRALRKREFSKRVALRFIRKRMS